MMAAPKPPTGLPGSVGIHLPAFKRKRIEQWCEDVAQYLKAGSLCRSVIGHVIEDNRLPGGAGPKSAPPASNQRTIATTAAAASSIGTLTEMLALGNTKKENGGGNNHGNNNNNNNPSSGNTTTCIKVTKIDSSAPPPGRGTPMPDTSGPLPVVKFSYSHNNEQRRRIDRLVQGLPVLSSAGTPNPGSALERLSGTSGAVIYVNGEEPVRPPGGYGSAGSRERQSHSPGRASPAPVSGHPPRPASRSSSGEPRQRASRASHAPSRHHSLSPSPSRHPPRPGPASTQSHGLSSTANKVSSSEIVVIEDEFPGQSNQHNEYTATGFRSLNFDGSHRLKKAHSQKLYKARQRMLASTRRSRDQNHAPSHMPVQSCWAMAELTW